MRIALAGQAYSGKSTLARALATYYDFTIVDYSRHIKEAASRALLVAAGVEVTSEMIERNKKDYRAFLQNLAQVGGYNDGNGVVTALKLAAGLNPLHPITHLPLHMVFDNVRTRAQLDILQDYGFVLVTVETPLEIRFQRAHLAGVTESEWYAVNDHHTEKLIPQGYVRLDGLRSPHELANDLALLGSLSYDDSIYNDQDDATDAGQDAENPQHIPQDAPTTH